MAKDFGKGGGPNPKPATSSKVTRVPIRKGLSDSVERIKDLKEKGITIEGPGPVRDQDMDGITKPLGQDKAPIIVFEQELDGTSPSSKITSRGMGADYSQKWADKGRQSQSKKTYGLDANGKFQMYTVEARSPLSTNRSSPYIPVQSAGGSFDLSLEVEKLANFVQFIKAVENGIIKVSDEVKQTLVNKTIPAQMEIADKLQYEVQEGRYDNSVNQAELNEQIPIDQQRIDEAVAELFGNQPIADAAEEWRNRIQKPGTTAINVEPIKSGPDRLVPGTTKQAYSVEPASGESKIKILYGGETSEPATSTIPIDTDTYTTNPNPNQNLEGVGFQRASMGEGTPPPRRALNLEEIDPKAGSFRFVSTPVEVDGGTKQFPLLTFERLDLTGDGSGYVTDSQAVAVEIYQPRDKTKPVTHFGPNKLAGAPVDLSGATSMGPIIRDSKNNLFRIEFSDEASGQIENVVPLTPEEGSRFATLYEQTPSSWPEVADKYAGGTKDADLSVKPEGSFGEFPITDEAIINAFDVLENYFQASPMAAPRSDGTVRPAYSTMRDEAATFAERFNALDYFDYNADESLKDVAGIDELQGRGRTFNDWVVADLIGRAIKGSKEAIGFVEGRGEYTLPETAGTRREFGKQFAAGRVVETKKILDEILRLEAQGEPVDFTKRQADDGRTYRPSKSEAQAAYDEAVANYEAFDGQSFEGGAGVTDGMPMPSIISEVLGDLPDYNGPEGEATGRGVSEYNRKISDEDKAFLFRELNLRARQKPYELSREGETLASGQYINEDAARARQALEWLARVDDAQISVRENRINLLRDQQTNFLRPALQLGQQYVEAGLTPPEALVRAQEELRAIEKEGFKGGFDVGGDGIEGGAVPFPVGLVALMDKGFQQKGSGLIEFIAKAKGIPPEQVRNVIEAAISEENSPTTQSRVNYETGDPLTIPPPEFTVPKELQEAIDIFNRAMPDEAKSNIFSKQRRDSTSIRANQGLLTPNRLGPEAEALRVLNDLSGKLAEEVLADDSITGVIRKAAELRAKANGTKGVSEKAAGYEVGDSRLSTEGDKNQMSTKIKTTAAIEEAAAFGAYLIKVIEEQGLNLDPDVKGSTLSNTGEANASKNNLGKPGVSGVVAERAVVAQDAAAGKMESQSGMPVEANKGADPNTTLGKSPFFNVDDPDGKLFILYAKRAMEDPNVAAAVNRVGGLRMFLAKVLARGRSPELLEADARLQNSSQFSENQTADQQIVTDMKTGTKVPAAPEVPQVFLDKVKNAVLSRTFPIALDGVDVNDPGFFSKLAARIYGKNPDALRTATEAEWKDLVEETITNPMEEKIARDALGRVVELESKFIDDLERESPGAGDLVTGLAGEIEDKPMAEMPNQMDLAAKEAGGPDDAANLTDEELASQKRIYESNNEDRLPPLLGTGEDASNVNRFRQGWQLLKDESLRPGFRTSQGAKRNASLRLYALKTAAKNIQDLEVQEVAYQWLDTLAKDIQEYFPENQAVEVDTRSPSLEQFVLEMEAETAGKAWEEAEKANPGQYEHLTPAPGGLLRKGKPRRSAGNATRTDFSKYATPPENAGTAVDMDVTEFYVDGTDPTAVDALRSASGEQLFLKQIIEGGVDNEFTGTIKELEGELASVNDKLLMQYEWTPAKDYRETSAAIRDTGGPDARARNMAFMQLIRKRQVLQGSIQKQVDGYDPDPSAKPTVRYVEADNGQQYAVLSATFYPNLQTRTPGTMEAKIEADTGRSVGHNPIPDGITKELWIPGSTNPDFTLKSTDASFTPGLGVPQTQADNAAANRVNRGRVGRITKTEDGYAVDEIENVNDKWYTVNTPEARQGDPDPGTEDTVIFDDEAYDSYTEGMRANEEASIEENYEENYEDGDDVTPAAVPHTGGFSGTVTDADVDKAATAKKPNRSTKVDDSTDVDEPQTEVDSVKQESEDTSQNADVQPNRSNLIRNILLGGATAAVGAGLYNANQAQKEEDKAINKQEPPPITPAPQTSASRIREKQKAQPAPVQPVAEDPTLQAGREFARRYLEEQKRLGTGL